MYFIAAASSLFVATGDYPDAQSETPGCEGQPPTSQQAAPWPPPVSISASGSSVLQRSNTSGQRMEPAAGRDGIDVKRSRPRNGGWVTA
jgi:hypothetical protein